MTSAHDRSTAGFSETFGRPPEVVVRSPGRVNLIGDHTDYNDGFALPIAIEQAVWVAAARRTDRTVVVDSEEAGSATIDLDRLEPTDSWIDYVAGTLESVGAPALGFDAHVVSEVPTGAGLSSSAAIEVGFARLVSALEERSWDPVEAARRTQWAENEFVGMPSGILDQLTVAAAVEDHAIRIDCRSLDWEPVALPSGTKVVILDSGTRRKLVDSSYENRRRACEAAADKLGVPALRDASADDVADAGLPDELAKRARHVVTENARVLAAAAAMTADDPVEVGRLMDESHRSLRDDFESSNPAIDLVTELARGHEGCFGARITGGGFAGCGVALVAEDALDDFIGRVGPAYAEASGLEPRLYATGAAAGTSLA